MLGADFEASAVEAFEPAALCRRLYVGDEVFDGGDFFEEFGFDGRPGFFLDGLGGVFVYDGAEFYVTCAIQEGVDESLGLVPCL